ncbi:Uncharacterised protein [Kluyvera ascorbata]|nr:Uncharacterised protein [Kluyvera ascorbata]STW99502.1 Uncharacterised protein [Kluyvera ascorbata]STX01613.1 Uncharacterised protein [Kluyvera ascorbata]
MKNWAIIENGVVINAILWDGQSSWEPSEGQSVVELPMAEDGSPSPGIGWTYSGGMFIAPPEEVIITPE